MKSRTFKKGRFLFLTSAFVSMAMTLGAWSCSVGANQTRQKGTAALDALIAAYPDFLARYDERDLIWKDGTRMALLSGQGNRSPDEIIEHPFIEDIFAWDYPAGAVPAPPINGADPGRARPTEFFAKMYGDCRSNSVFKNLAAVTWVDGTQIMFSTVNNANRALAAVVEDLKSLGSNFAQYISPAAGTYSCRVIAGTDLTSMHSYGAAIDINTSYSDYWRWSRGKRAIWRNQIPMEIVSAFERHGFIWGGRWTHFDTMHFEYRPELLLAAKREH